MSSSIPATCKAGCVVNPGPDFSVVIEEVAVPEPGPDELLLRMSTTGLCHSDISYMSTPFMSAKMIQAGVRSPGHEGVGVVVKVGSAVTDWKIGDRGGIKPVWRVCFQCETCLAGFEMHCQNLIPTGLGVPGTYQGYLTSPASYTQRIPDEVDDFTAAPLMCSGTTVYRSLYAAELKAGDWVVISGAGGGVGHFGIQLAKVMGLRVIAVDSGAAKKSLCEELGSDSFIDFQDVENVSEEVLKLTGGKSAHAILVASGSAQAYQTAIQMVRFGGKIMCIGHLKSPPGSLPSGLDPNLLIFKSAKVIGTMIGNMADAQKVLEFAAQGQLRAVYESFPIDQLPQAVAKLHAGEVAGRLVVDFNA
ncbi:GroES-like protein [Lophium mytilinum]|uniref:GroES-like protein n=1 Tax=Lophium mytilinum TaxID=390894 RepID=A0A6A6QM61_9PEZI|nr:GroES-like protein [Lophium mytilinum]